MSNFKIGEKVVCIDDSNLNYNGSLAIQADRIIKYNIYTIDYFNSVGGLVLKEVFSGMHFDGEKGGYSVFRFRKLNYEFAYNILKKISESVNQKHLQN